MDKHKIKTLQDLITAAAKEYGDKIFLKEKHGKDVIEKSFNTFCEDVQRMTAFISSKRNSDKLLSSEHQVMHGLSATLEQSAVEMPLFRWTHSLAVQTSANC